MNNIPSVFWLVPAASVVALGMAWYFFKTMMKSDEGTPRMREIAEYVRNQLKEDMMYDQISIKEYKDPFNGS